MMDNRLPVTLVMTAQDYNKWVSNDDLFVRVYIKGNRIAYKLFSYDQIWKECLNSMDDEMRSSLIAMNKEQFQDFKNDYIYDYIMRYDSYTYNDYINSDSFVPSIWFNQIGYQHYYAISFGDYRSMDL